VRSSCAPFNSSAASPSASPMQRARKAAPRARSRNTEDDWLSKSRTTDDLAVRFRQDRTGPDYAGRMLTAEAFGEDLRNFFHADQIATPIAGAITVGLAESAKIADFAWWMRDLTRHP
jgi:hypothetical protein